MEFEIVNNKMLLIILLYLLIILPAYTLPLHIKSNMKYNINKTFNRTII